MQTMNSHTLYHSFKRPIRTIAWPFLAFSFIAFMFSGCCFFGERRPPVFWYNEWDVEDSVFTTCGDPWEECKIDLELECCEEADQKSGDKGSTDPYEPLVKEYRIANGDSLDISVFGDQDTIVTNIVVAPDGKIYYLFLDGILAKGKTIDELQKELQENLKDMFIEPNVTIMPRFMSNQSVIILGRINRPGLYPLYRSLTIRQGIGLAGGIVSQRQLVNDSSSGLVQVSTNYNIPVVDLKNSFLVRQGKKLDVNFDDLINKPSESEDIYLKPGDYIYIASDERPGVFMLGNVLGPQVIPHRDDLTLLQAICTVGGWTRGFPYSADVNDCLIIRGSLECPQVARVNLCDLIYGKTRDIPLERGDIVYVHNKNLRFGRQLIRIALNSFVSSFGGNAGARFSQKQFNFGNGND